MLTTSPPMERLLYAIHSELQIANSHKRAELIVGLLGQLESDPDIAAIYHDIEYGRFAYKADGFHESADEMRLDKLLRALNNIALLHSRGLIEDEDLKFFSHRVTRVARDAGVRAYMQSLESPVRDGQGAHPYGAFVHLSEALVPEPADMAS